MAAAAAMLVVVSAFLDAFLCNFMEFLMTFYSSVIVGDGVIRPFCPT